MKIEGKTILSGLVRTPTTDNYILLVSLSAFVIEFNNGRIKWIGGDTNHGQIE